MLFYINLILKKIITVSTKILSCKTLFNIYNNATWAPNQNSIRVLECILEWFLKDRVTLSNGCWNVSIVFTEINYILDLCL